MRISDWSSDVCSSDLQIDARRAAESVGAKIERGVIDIDRNGRCEAEIGAETAKTDIGFAGTNGREGEARRIARQAFGIADRQPFQRLAAKGGHGLRPILEPAFAALGGDDDIAEIGSAACRERVCPYV